MAKTVKMGIVSSTYLILGVYLPYDGDLATRLCDEGYDCNEGDDLFALVDDMCDQYIIIGKSLGHTRGEGGAEDPVPIEINVTDADKQLVQSKIRDELGLDEKVSLFMMTHYS